ncbi:MAG: hypothetical protein Q8K52_03515 [Thiobacillus sp.]|nr:hypothetical protein [Thiobacillus sp.]
MKRKLLALLAGLPLLTACVPAEVRAARKAGEEREKTYHDSLSPKEQAMLLRFHGIGIQLVVDAVAGAEMEGVKIYSDNGYSIFSSGSVALRKRSIGDFGSARVPLWVRVIWREKPKAIWGKNGGIDWDGPIIGDFTLPIAERIPDAVLESLHKDPGMLRIKFRLHPNGVYFGWDIERRPGYRPGYSVSAVHDMPGGDFQEAKIFNGKAVRKGWYIDKNGQKIETDY